MVLALGVLSVLAVLALTIMAIVISEKLTQQSSYAGARSFNSADAASEAGVNWLLLQPAPPPIVDASSNVLVSAGYTNLSADHRYKYDVTYVTKRPRPGWSVEYKDYQYKVEASGASAQQSQSAIRLGAMRLYREGY